MMNKKTLSPKELLKGMLRKPPAPVSIEQMNEAIISGPTHNEELVIEPESSLTRDGPPLEDLLAQCDPDVVHGEIHFSKPDGKEIL
jgi:antitoxin component of MazEF toxin-antitoxin module